MFIRSKHITHVFTCMIEDPYIPLFNHRLSYVALSSCHKKQEYKYKIWKVSKYCLARSFINIFPQALMFCVFFVPRSVKSKHERSKVMRLVTHWMWLGRSEQALGAEGSRDRASLVVLYFYYIVHFYYILHLDIL